MNAQELRLSNIILMKFANSLPGGEPYFAWSTVKIEDLQAMIEWPENYKPAPLTKDWLTIFGFKSMAWNEHKNPRFVKSFIDLIETPSKQFIFRGRVITSVHQLQNLFFALCGEELTVQP